MGISGKYQVLIEEYNLFCLIGLLFFILFLRNGIHVYRRVVRVCMNVLNMAMALSRTRTRCETRLI